MRKLTRFQKHNNSSILLRSMLKMIFLAFLGSCVLVTGFAQEKFINKKDLQPEWLAFDGTAFQPVAEDVSGRTSSIHFSINTRAYPKHYIQIKSRKKFYVFINGKLMRESHGVCLLSLDSLKARLSETDLTFSVYQKKIDRRDLKTFLVAAGSTTPVLSEMETKPASFLRDFVVLAGLLLTVFFVVMIRVQPKLASDYFSVRRVISLREGDDNQAHARFAITSNLWFYIFCSLLMALFMLILFYHLPGDYSITTRFDSRSFLGIFSDWIKLSFIILTILLTKIVLIFMLSNLFGFRGIAGVHFFNGIRVLLIVTSTLSVIVFIYFISRGQDFSIYTTFLFTLVITLGIWIGLVFFKLSNRVEHSMFHLFSYICATEVIPLLITVKVLFQ